MKYVEDQLKQLGFKPGQQQLTVTTTLDYGKQQLAEQTVRENLQANLSKDTVGLLSSAMVAMDPKTGQILAYVGAPDVNARAGGFDFAGVEPVSPGSSVKPFTYGKALLDRIMGRAHLIGRRTESRRFRRALQRRRRKGAAATLDCERPWFESEENYKPKRIRSASALVA